MKSKRIFIHFLKNGRDVGTFGIFENDENHEKLVQKLNISNEERTVILTKENYKVAKSITGMKL